MALRAWVAGEGLANKTEILTELVINGNHWSGKASLPGTVPNPVSIDNGLTITAKTREPQPETFEVGKDLDMDMQTMPNPFEFTVIAIAESANNPERPNLNKIIVRAVQENYVGWTEWR